MTQDTSRPQRPTPRAGVLDIAAYVPGKSKAAAGVKLHKLSSNETPLGASPKAIAAFQAAAATLEFYPDGAASGLREAIGKAYGLDPARIVCGNGSDDLLHLLAGRYGDAEQGLDRDAFLLGRVEQIGPDHPVAVCQQVVGLAQAIVFHDE